MATDARETADVIEAEAARWVWRLSSGDLEPDERARLNEWLASDPRRRGALLQAEAVWATMDRSRLLPPEAISARRVRVWPRLFSRGRAAWLAGAASALAVLVLAVSLFANLSGERYTTGRGEIRRLPLKDGSALVMNSKSAVAVQWRSDERDIRVSEGEAWFHVAPNLRWPFVVAAGDLRVAAVGTAFSVHLTDAGPEILVTEGVVEAWKAGDELHKLSVRAGEAASLPADAPTVVPERVTVASIERALAWRDGKIDLDGDTLASAVEAFNRYNSRLLVIADARLANRRIYGLFRADDPVAFARAIGISLQASVSVRTEEIDIGQPGR